MRSVADPVAYDGYDAVVIVTDHTDVDYARMVREVPSSSTRATCS